MPIKISARERQRRQDAVSFARASVGLEGFTPSVTSEALARRFVAGEIELAQFVHPEAEANLHGAATHLVNHRT